MRSGVGVAVVLLGMAVPCFANPVGILPGQTVAPGTGSYGGKVVGSVSGSLSGGVYGLQTGYEEQVYADPSNPFCAGCYDFVLTGIGDPGMNAEITGATLGGFAGGPFSFAVGYVPAPVYQGGFAFPSSVAEDAAGDAISFNLQLYFYEESDPLILYSNATGLGAGSLSVAGDAGPNGETPEVVSGPALVPVAATPEPGGLVLLGTGALGLAGVLRRRFIQA